MGESEGDLSEMSEGDLRKLAKRAIAKASTNSPSVQGEAQQAGGMDMDMSAQGQQASLDDLGSSGLAATLARQTAAMRPYVDLHDKRLTPDEKKVLKHEKMAAERAEAIEARRDAKMNLSAKKGSIDAGPVAITGPAEDIKLDAADEEINAWLRQQPQQWLKEQLRLAVDEHSTGAAGAVQLAGLRAAADAAAAAAPQEDLVCVSLVATATDEWCSSFCAEHSCPESMCKCEGGGPAQA